MMLDLICTLSPSMQKPTSLIMAKKLLDSILERSYFVVVRLGVFPQYFVIRSISFLLNDFNFIVLQRWRARVGLHGGGGHARRVRLHLEHGQADPQDPPGVLSQRRPHRSHHQAGHVLAKAADVTRLAKVQVWDEPDWLGHAPQDHRPFPADSRHGGVPGLRPQHLDRAQMCKSGFIFEHQFWTDA